MPTLAPLLDAPFAVQFHVAAALLAIALLPLTLFRRRKDRVHKTAGYLWVTTMTTAALSSFFINDIRTVGPFSAIHLISLYTLFGLWQAVRAAMRKDMVTHRAAMTGISAGALGLAGLLSLMPGRRMNEAFFGGYETEGFLLVLALAVVVVGVVLSTRRAKPV